MTEYGSDKRVTKCVENSRVQVPRTFQLYRRDERDREDEHQERKNLLGEITMRWLVVNTHSVERTGIEPA